MALQLQMSWQPHLKKRKNGPPLGLKNLGNTCYLNSVLQCLTYTAPLANFCLKFQHTSLCDLAAEQDKKSECPFCLLERRIARSLSIDLTLEPPGKFINGLKLFAEHFALGRQEDAHEFLRYVIDACHNTCLRLKKLQQQQRSKVISNGGGGEGFSGSTIVKEIFGGTLQSQVKCLTCGAESNKVDEIMDISLDLLNSDSLKEAFQKFFQPEILDGNNKYKCDTCKKLVAARKQMSIIQAPNVLVIQLKRFEGVYGGKIDKAIAFEEFLVLSSFMRKANQDPHPEYNLFATIVHSGISPDSGHYYAYIKDAMSRWYCCNDSYVSLSTLQEVFSEKVYILFFSRTKQRPVLSKKALATNGSKSNGHNGSDKSKNLTAGHMVKSVGSRQYVDHLSVKDNSGISQADKVPSSLQKKYSSPGIYGTRKLQGTASVKFVVHKKESRVKNADVKAFICIPKSEKKMSSLEHRNGISQSKLVDAVNSEKSQSSPSANGNGKIQRTTADSVEDGHEDNGTRNRIVMEKGISNRELQNSSIYGHADNSGPKRKLHDEDSCIVLAGDAQSSAKFNELKESLGKEASLVLRSCGWSDEVYSFMRSKKVCAREAVNDASNSNELKRLLIAEVKSTFISQIPESLKATLIRRLRSFSQEKQSSGP